MLKNEKAMTKSEIQETHPIFKFLKDLMRGRDYYNCISSDYTRKIKISRYTQPAPKNDPTKKCFDWIEVAIESYGGRINYFKQYFYFYYYPHRDWQVRTGGLLSVKSALDISKPKVWTFRYTEHELYPADDSHIWLKYELSNLLILIKNAEYYHPHHEKEPSLSPL